MDVTLYYQEYLWEEFLEEKICVSSFQKFLWNCYTESSENWLKLSKEYVDDLKTQKTFTSSRF